MTTKKILSAGAAAFALALVHAAPAAAQTDQARLIVGTWLCASTQDDLLTAGTLTYTADGHSIFVLTLLNPKDPLKFHVAVEGNGLWALKPGSLLSETYERAQVASGVLNGAPIDEATRKSMVEEMMSTTLEPSPITLTSQTLVIAGDGGTSTKCSRAG